MNKIEYWLMGVGCWLMASCASTPEHVSKVNQLPDIYPDYIGVTIPADIAPLNFNLADEDIDCMDVVARGSKGGELHTNGDWADFDIDDWQSLTQQNRGGKESSSSSLEISNTKTSQMMTPTVKSPSLMKSTSTRSASTLLRTRGSSTMTRSLYS